MIIIKILDYVIVHSKEAGQFFILYACSIQLKHKAKNKYDGLTRQMGWLGKRVIY